LATLAENVPLTAVIREENPMRSATPPDGGQGAKIDRV
jgi:hypothetical protein